MKKQLPKILSLIGLTIIIFSIKLPAQINPALATQLQQILNNRVQVNGEHGVSACVIMPNGDIWKGTAGLSGTNLPITDTTTYHGASITKTNIATLMLLLAEDGLIHLDSSWHKYVNLNVNFDTTITIRQILSHTSGIADYLEVQGSGHNVTNDFNHAFTPVEILENIVSGVPDFAPGTDFAYSTSNYVLAALIAETITGNPVQQELRTRIWDPLGMNHTYFGGFEAYTEPRAGVYWDFESGLQNYSSNPETAMLTYGYGGANIVSTPEDLAHFARALFTGNILSPASMQEMQIYSLDSYATWCAGYGLGIHHAYAFPSDSLLGHDGYYTNLSDMFHSYDYGFTLVTMSNTPNYWFATFDSMYNALKNYMILNEVENPTSKDIHLFPNPTNSHLTINLDKPYTKVEISIRDLTGKIIYTTTSSKEIIEINTKAFAEGIYILKLQTAEGIKTKKFIVAK